MHTVHLGGGGVDASQQGRGDVCVSRLADGILREPTSPGGSRHSKSILPDSLLTLTYIIITYIYGGISFLK